MPRCPARAPPARTPSRHRRSAAPGPARRRHAGTTRPGTAWPPWHSRRCCARPGHARPPGNRHRRQAADPPGPPPAPASDRPPRRRADGPEAGPWRSATPGRRTRPRAARRRTPLPGTTSAPPRPAPERSATSSADPSAADAGRPTRGCNPAPPAFAPTRARMAPAGLPPVPLICSRLISSPDRLDLEEESRPAGGSKNLTQPARLCRPGSRATRCPDSGNVSAQPSSRHNPEVSISTAMPTSA